MFAYKYKKSIGGQHQRAFTLVEIIVSLGIFSVVAVVALGALVKIISANKKAQTLQSAMNNLNFALESMSRELRVGSAYLCANDPSATILGSSFATGNCPYGYISPDNDTLGFVLAFRSSEIDTTDTISQEPCHLIYSYRLVSTGTDVDGNFSWKIQKAEQSSCAPPSPSNIVADDYADITDPGLVITGYYVKVYSDIATHPYPMVVISLSGYTGLKIKERTYFDIQTAVSARSVSS